ncbi:hypothetical protein HDU92_000210 [Lobulomyces angularis]|nr:hypothetical protein HDU92_000210 [Lobulomyces angularis]
MISEKEVVMDDLNSLEINTTDFSANIGTDEGDFFQSDRDLELSKLKADKKKNFQESGNPIKLNSKILKFELVLDLITYSSPTKAYTAESGFVSKKIDLITGKTLRIFRGHTGPVTSVAIIYNSDGDDEFIITGSWDKTARKWCTKTGKTVKIFSGHTDFVKSVKCVKNFLLTASSDKSIIQWDINTGKELQVFKGHTRGVEDLVVDDSSSQFFYSCSSDTTIKKWSMITGKVVMELNGHLTSVYNLHLSDGMLWSTSADKFAKRWDLEAMVCDTNLEHPDFVKFIKTCGDYAITGSRDEEVRVWDINVTKFLNLFFKVVFISKKKSEKCVYTFQGHFDEVSCIQILSNNKFVSGSLDGTLRTWSLSDISACKSVSKESEKKEFNTKAKKNSSTAMTAEEEAELNELLDD